MHHHQRWISSFRLSFTERQISYSIFFLFLHTHTRAQHTRTHTDIHARTHILEMKRHTHPFCYFPRSKLHSAVSTHVSRYHLRMITKAGAAHVPLWGDDCAKMRPGIVKRRATINCTGGLSLSLYFSSSLSSRCFAPRLLRSHRDRVKDPRVLPSMPLRNYLIAQSRAPTYRISIWGKRIVHRSLIRFAQETANKKRVRKNISTNSLVHLENIKRWWHRIDDTINKILIFPRSIYLSPRYMFILYEWIIFLSYDYL